MGFMFTNLFIINQLLSGGIPIVCWLNHSSKCFQPLKLTTRPRCHASRDDFGGHASTIDYWGHTHTYYIYTHTQSYIVISYRYIYIYILSYIYIYIYIIIHIYIYNIMVHHLYSIKYIYFCAVREGCRADPPGVFQLVP